MSPRYGNEDDHVEITPVTEDRVHVRIRVSKATVFVVIFLLMACMLFAAMVVNGGAYVVPNLG